MRPCSVGWLVFWLSQAAIWSAPARAQISPPGLGDAQTAAWLALGLRQSLGAAQLLEYVTYVGFGATSEQSALNPYGHPNIFVLNHELYDRFSPHWQYSVGLSYRRQDSYEDHHGVRDEKRIQEARLYGRMSSLLERGRFKLVNTLRPELRGFTRRNFGQAAEPVQVRLRFKTQLGCKLDIRGVHRVLVAAEALASDARAAGRDGTWTGFEYRESRFAFFYSWRASDRLAFDVGYMNNLLGRSAPLTNVHYLALDLVWLNPFGTESS